MNRRLRRPAVRRAVFAGLVFLPLLGAAAQQHDLKPFRSDGCSLFPDDSKILKTDWCDCCLVHDRAYWLGGTWEQRKAVDERFRDCVAARTGNGVFAEVLYRGVRFGGSPYFYNWYRWGYGWPYDRGYQAVSPAERELAERLLEQDRQRNADICDDD